VATAADILYLARKERGLSQTELAWLSGVRQPKISAYERGEVVPKYDVLERLVGHCGLRLAVRLEDNSYPTLPAGPGVWRLKELQWAVSRSPRSFGVLDVRAVPPKGWEEMTVLVRLGSGASGSSVPEGLVEHLRRAVGRVAVVAVGHGATPEAFATAVQVAFVGRTRPPRETRFAPPRADDRWYGTRLVGAGGEVVEGTLTLAGASLTFTPAQPLDFATTYTATLEATVKGLGTAALGEELSWSFTTVSLAPEGDEGTGGGTDTDGDGIPDDIDPDRDADGDGIVDGEDEDMGLGFVAGVSPRPGERIAEDGAISLTLSVPLDWDSVSPDAIRVYKLPHGNQVLDGKDRPSVPGTLSYDPATQTLTFTPDEAFKTNPPHYWVFIELDALDTDGNPVVVNAHWRFRIEK